MRLCSLRVQADLCRPLEWLQVQASKRPCSTLVQPEGADKPAGLRRQHPQSQADRCCHAKQACT